MRFIDHLVGVFRSERPVAPQPDGREGLPSQPASNNPRSGTYWESGSFFITVNGKKVMQFTTPTLGGTWLEVINGNSGTVQNAQIFVRSEGGLGGFSIQAVGNWFNAIHGTGFAPGWLRFYEDESGASHNAVGLKAPNTLALTYDLILPPFLPATGQLLTTLDAGGTTSFTDREHYNIAQRVGSMDVWQRGTSIAIAASTVAYANDGAYLATGANQASVVARSGGIANGSQFAASTTRNSGQTGTGVMRYAIPLDTDEISKLRGKFVGFSFYANAGANWSPTSGTLSYIVYAGTGAAAKRNATPYTSETTVVSGSVNLTPGGANALVQIGSVAVLPASTTQLEIQFFWTPVGTAGAADTITIDEVQLENLAYASDATSPFCHIAFKDQLELCQRFFFKTFPYGTAPAQNAGNGGAWLFQQTTGAAAANTGSPDLPFPELMRITPTVTTFNPGAANAQVRNLSRANDGSALANNSISDRNYSFTFTTSAGSAVGDTNALHLTADASI